MFTRAIVRPPAANFSEGLTTAELGMPDYEVALRQHEAYCAALEQCGLELIRLEPDSNYADSTFVEDTAVLIQTRSQTHPLTQVVLTRPGAASRRGEVPSIKTALEKIRSISAIHTIEGPGTLDGGDVCEAGNHFFIGVSERTNEAGAQQLTDLLSHHGFTSSFVDIRFNDAMRSEPGAVATGSPLHLKSGLAHLSDNRLLVTEALADRKEFSGYQLIHVEAGEEYAANCVQVNSHVLIAAGFPSLEKTIRQHGYQTIVLVMSEFQKMDGGLSCLSLRF
jgi:dimethylargininase